MELNSSNKNQISDINCMGMQEQLKILLFCLIYPHDVLKVYLQYQNINKEKYKRILMGQDFMQVNP
jgi:hypothetical protein